jgi:hypothetical protein
MTRNADDSRTWVPDEDGLRPYGDGDDLSPPESDNDGTPDPVWGGMSRSEFKRIGAYIRETADRMWLRDWWFNLMWTPTPDPDADAETRVIYGRKIANIHLGRDFAYYPESRKKHIVVHELLHCHFDVLHSGLREALPDLIGDPSWHIIDALQTERIEHTVDTLAEVLANWLPDLPDEDDEDDDDDDDDEDEKSDDEGEG